MVMTRLRATYYISIWRTYRDDDRQQYSRPLSFQPLDMAIRLEAASLPHTIISCSDSIDFAHISQIDNRADTFSPIFIAFVARAITIFCHLPRRISLYIGHSAAAHNNDAAPDYLFSLGHYAAHDEARASPTASRHVAGILLGHHKTI